MEIQGTTKVVGLLGWPVAHSVSPQMHNAAFRALGLDWSYIPLPAPPDALGDAVRGLRALGLRGANVTVPHKEAIIPLVDELAPEARAIGAVNTLVVHEDGRLTGHNTDALGVGAALQEAGCRVAGCRALILGAGGAARAAAYALLQAGAEVQVLARRPAQAEALARDMAGAFPQGRISPGLLSPEALPQAAAEAHLLVHATPVGMWPHGDASLWPEQEPVPQHLWVFDLVYRPARTRLLRQAEAAGARTIEGAWMLIHQAVASFHLWTGVEPPLEVMAKACHDALGMGRGGGDP
ncbi:MAG: shikimate dehydrogenase [Anaerolineae bacterium]|nr:shikimate dehydrogenase [Anaerolineae bacterium]